MSSVLLVSPLAVGTNPKELDNPLAPSKRAGASQNQTDLVWASNMLKDMYGRLTQEFGVDVKLLSLTKEPRQSRQMLEDKGGAILVADSISFHTFTNAYGHVTRHVVVLYPVSPFRRAELANLQILTKVMKAAESNDRIDVVDLRPFEAESKFLEGGSVVFSADGRFAYLTRSSRADVDVFNVLCSTDNLNIPPENRFVLSSSITAPTSASSVTAPCPHTNLLGWCGKDICVWANTALVFDNDTDAENFFVHLRENYQVILQLNEDEVRAFAGNSVELIGYTRAADGSMTKERRVLCMSEGAKKKLEPKNLRALEQWYGADCIISFYAESIERRCGESVRSCMALTSVHGPTPPARTEPSLLTLLGIVDNA